MVTTLKYFSLTYLPWSYKRIEFLFQESIRFWKLSFSGKFPVGNFRELPRGSNDLVLLLPILAFSSPFFLKIVSLRGRWEDCDPFLKWQDVINFPFLKQKNPHEESIDGISHLLLEIFHHRQPSHMWSDHDHDMSTPLDLNQGGLSLSWKFPRNGNGQGQKVTVTTEVLEKSFMCGHVT